LNTKPPSLSSVGSIKDWVNHYCPEQKTDSCQGESWLVAEGEGQTLLLPDDFRRKYMYMRGFPHSKQGSTACWSLEKVFTVTEASGKGCKEKESLLPYVCMLSFSEMRLVFILKLLGFS
jgi:hypothetical protein